MTKFDHDKTETVSTNRAVRRRPWAGGYGIHRNLLRPDASERADRVTYIELFFDLIFVFALTQLSRYLYENQSWVGAVESAVLVLALWWMWVYTTWVTNYLDPVKLPVRGVVIGLALLGLVVSASIYESFGDRGLVFALAYVALQIGRTGFMLLAVARHNRDLHRSYVRIMIWLVVAGVFWIAGAVLPLEFRLAAWVVALVIEYASASLDFRVPGLGRSGIESWDLSGPHIAERSALFVIIALGESFLVTGYAFVAQESSLIGVIGLLLAFLSVLAMWWLYFDHSERVGAKALQRSPSPGRIARVAYTYVHAVIIGGIVLSSVADKEILEHPADDITLATAVIITGGPFLYLAGMFFFRLRVTGEVLVSHLVGLGLLLLAFTVAVLGAPSTISPLGLGALSVGSLVIIACWETVLRARTGTTEAAAG